MNHDYETMHIVPITQNHETSYQVHAQSGGLMMTGMNLHNATNWCRERDLPYIVHINKPKTIAVRPTR